MLCLTILEKSGDKKGFIDGTITKLDHIPNGVMYMQNTFEYCYNLTDAPTIPNSVINMNSAFALCNSLTNVPSISQNVENMSFTFASCSNLASIPNIPASVKNMSYALQGCTSLGDVIIESEQVTNATHCFRSTTATKNVYIPFTKKMVENYRISVKTSIGGHTIPCFVNTLTGEATLTADTEDDLKKILGLPTDVTSYTFTQCTINEETSKITTVVTYTPVTMTTGLDIGGGIGGINPSQQTISLNQTFTRLSNEDTYVPSLEPTETYNAFVNAGYDENGTSCGVYLKDINTL